MKLTKLTREILRGRRHARRMNAEGFRRIRGLQTQTAEGLLQIVAVEISADGYDVWIKTERRPEFTK